VGREGLAPMTCGFQVWCPNHLATLPPQETKYALVKKPDGKESSRKEDKVTRKMFLKKQK